MTVESEVDRIRSMIFKRHEELVELIENEKAILLINIEDYIKSVNSKWVDRSQIENENEHCFFSSLKYSDLRELFESINGRLEESFQ